MSFHQVTHSSFCLTTSRTSCLIDLHVIFSGVHLLHVASKCCSIACVGIKCCYLDAFVVELAHSFFPVVLSAEYGIAAQDQKDKNLDWTGSGTVVVFTKSYSIS